MGKRTTRVVRNYPLHNISTSKRKQKRSLHVTNRCHCRVVLDLICQAGEKYIRNCIWREEDAPTILYKPISPYCIWRVCHFKVFKPELPRTRNDTICGTETVVWYAISRGIWYDRGRLIRIAYSKLNTFIWIVERFFGSSNNICT